MNWDEIAAICGIMTFVGAVGAFLMNATIDRRLSLFTKELDQRFITHDQAELMIQRATRMAAHGD